MAAGKDAGTRGGTDGCGGIETVKAQAGLCHFIKDGGLEDFMAHVTHVTPALIIGHGQNDIRTFTCTLNGEDYGCD